MTTCTKCRKEGPSEQYSVSIFSLEPPEYEALCPDCYSKKRERGGNEIEK